MSGSFLSYGKSGRVATISLNRPDSRNAIGSHQDCVDFVDAIAQSQDDAELSCIILTGVGKSFSAGGDLNGMKNRNGIGPLASPVDTRANYKRGVQQVVKALWECELPMIAAINGHAVGLGLDLACLCDMRISADSAKFASSFIKMGIVPGDGGAWILPRAVGLAKASEMIFTGEFLDAQEALACGLVSRVVSAEVLMDEARTLADKVVQNPAKALRLAKRLLREGQHSRFSDVLELSAAYQALAHETADHAEALDAFLEKRAPNFIGQ
jgi:enoyl-CoA hydratase/carnithine racemase